MKRRLVGGAEFGEMRICQNEGKEWFCLSDVCKALDLTTPAKVKQRLSERGMNIIHTPTYNQYGTMVMMEAESQNGTLVKTKTAIINESGLYSLILSSKLPQAREFKHWEVLVILSIVILSLRFSDYADRE